MGKPFTRLDNVTVRRGGTLLLDGIRLDVAAGEFVGLIGPNGAGKTTLLNVVAGFERFEGSLELFGERATHARGRSVRLRIGYVPQRLDVDPAFPVSAFEAVMMGGCGRTGVLRRPRAEDRAKALRLMEQLRISELAGRPLGRLSGGERQKALLARALFQEPDALLLDEPTAGLDIATQKEFLELVSTIHARRRLTVLFVTHDFNLLPAAMSRAALLNRGRIVFDGGVGEALSGDTLSELFRCRVESFERNGRRFISYG